VNNQIKLKTSNTNWKYILIVAILAVIVGGGIFGYLRWMEKVKAPKIEMPEKITKYPRSIEFFTTCARSYTEYPEGITEEEFKEKFLTVEEKKNLPEEEKKKMYEEFLEFEKIYEEFFRISDEDIESIFGETKRPEDFESSLSKGILGEKELAFLGVLYGWGDITPICMNNLIDENLRPPEYNEICKKEPSCCDLPEPKDIESAKKLVEKFFECTKSPIKVDFEKMEKLKYGYFVGGGWGHIEAAYITYYLTNAGCLLNCYAPYTYIAGIKQPLIEKKIKELEFEKLPEEVKAKIKEFENEIDSLYTKAISEKNAEICEEIKKEVEKVEVVAKKDTNGWEFKAMERESAFEYEDEYYQPCIEIIATKLNSESLCDKLPSPDYCRKELFLQYTDLCKETPVDITAKAEHCRKAEPTEEETKLCMEAIANIREKEDCIRKMALDTGNIELCKKLLDKDCQNELAIKLNKPGECVWNSCFEELAIKNNDIRLCKKASNEVWCISRVAFSQNDIKLCEKILKTYDREQCYVWFGTQAGEKGDRKLCEELPNQFAQGSCYLKVAVKINDVELCGNNQKCIIEIAVNTKNPKLCKTLTSSSKEECYRELGVEPPPPPYLGVRYILINPILQNIKNLPVDYGALIEGEPALGEVAVVRSSVADKVGIKENDIILEVNGKKIDEANDLGKLIKNYDVGDEITLKVLRQGKEIEIKAVLEEKKEGLQEKTEGVSDWITFRNEWYRYEIKYPKTWGYWADLAPSCPSGVKLCYRVYFAVRENPKDTILTIYNGYSETSGFQYLKPNIDLKDEEIKIQNNSQRLTTLFFVSSASGERLVVIRWFLKNDLKKYAEIQMWYTNELDENLKILNQILSTFRFLE